MDRHDLPDITADEVAQAHVLDLSVAGEHGVQFLSYWYDPGRGAFCLADAPNAAAMQEVHRVSHGLVANEIITVSEDNVLRFLGTIHNPRDASEATSAFRTILFTDLRGSTALLQDVGQAAYMGLLSEHDLIIRRALVAAQGREVKHTGDGVMASFEDAGQALSCAAAIQDGFDERTASGATPDLRVRIGLAAGEPVDHNDDMFGSTVNLASRICDAAEAGHILVSQLVRDLGAARGYTFLDAGERILRGFPRPVVVFELDRSSLPSAAGSPGVAEPAQVTEADGRAG
jgi:class 3 adenylate cyclase